MTTEDVVLGVNIVLLAVCAYAVTPKGTTASRFRWATLWFVLWMGAGVYLAWDKISTLWNSN